MYEQFSQTGEPSDRSKRFVSCSTCERHLVHRLCARSCQHNPRLTLTRHCLYVQTAGALSACIKENNSKVRLTSQHATSSRQTKRRLRRSPPLAQGHTRCKQCRPRAPASRWRLCFRTQSPLPPLLAPTSALCQTSLRETGRRPKTRRDQVHAVVTGWERAVLGKSDSPSTSPSGVARLHGASGLRARQVDCSCSRSGQSEAASAAARAAQAQGHERILR